MSEGDVMIVTMIVVGGQLSIQHLRGPPLLAVLPPGLSLQNEQILLHSSLPLSCPRTDRLMDACSLTHWHSLTYLLLFPPFLSEATQSSIGN